MDFQNALSGFASKLRGDEGSARLYGAGLVLSQLGAGQTPNAGPALQMLDQRRAQNLLKSQMQGGQFLDKFSPDEQAFLATLPPQAAQQLIAERIFARPQPVTPMEVNGQLVNPQTGEVIGDYRTQEAPGDVSYIATGEAAAALGLDPAKSYNITSGPEGMKASEIGGNGTTVTVHNGDGEVGTIPQGYELITDPETKARSLRPIPGGPEDTTREDAYADATIDDQIGLIDQIIKDPALEGITGMVQGRLPPLTQAGTDLNVKIEQVKGQAFLDAFDRLKGGGSITEREGQAATAAIARLDRAQSTQEYVAALSELREIMDRGRRRAAGETVEDIPVARLKFNPETGEFE